MRQIGIIAPVRIKTATVFLCCFLVHSPSFLDLIWHHVPLLDPTNTGKYIVKKSMKTILENSVELKLLFRLGKLLYSMLFYSVMIPQIVLTCL